MLCKGKNAERNDINVRLSCGHITASVDALEILVAVQEYFYNVLGGAIPVLKSIEIRGETHDLFQEAGNPRFSMIGPRRLVLDARRHFHLGPSQDASFIMV